MTLIARKAHTLTGSTNTLLTCRGKLRLKKSRTDKNQYISQNVTPHIMFFLRAVVHYIDSQDTESFVHRWQCRTSDLRIFFRLRVCLYSRKVGFLYTMWTLWWCFWSFLDKHVCVISSALLQKTSNPWIYFICFRLSILN